MATTRTLVDVRGDTWLEPESYTYPSGGFTRRARVIIRRNEHNPLLDLPYGELRIVRASIPDTYFSIPARLRYRGRTIKGFISVDTNLNRFTFTPDPMRQEA